MKKMTVTPFEATLLAEFRSTMAKMAEIAELNGTALSNKDRIGRRKMGTARQGYVRLLLPIAINNIQVLPRDIDPKEQQELLQLIDTFAEIRTYSQKIYEMMSDTMMACGIDAVAVADSMNNALQDARKHNDAIDLAMREVDDYNGRFGKQMEEEDATPDAQPANPA